MKIWIDQIVKAAPVQKFHVRNRATKSTTGASLRSERNGEDEEPQLVELRRAMHGILTTCAQRQEYRAAFKRMTNNLITHLLIRLKMFKNGVHN